MNDAQYERIQELYDEVISQADDLFQADCVTSYGIEGGHFGIEVEFPDGGHQWVDIGGRDDFLTFAEAIGVMLDRIEEMGLSREQPFTIYDAALEWA